MAAARLGGRAGSAAATLSAALLALLLASCGGGSGEGLDENGRPVTGVGQAPVAPTLASIQVQVFTPRCTGCHAGAAAPVGLRLEEGLSAANLIGVASPRSASLVRVVAGNPGASFLIQKLEGTQTLGERMPQFGPYLPQPTIEVIRQWITAGAMP